MAYLDPAAGRAREGRQAAAQADMAAVTTTAAAGATPTKAEFDKVVTDLANARATINGLLAKLRAAGLLAP
ncbi:hypothetical protein [Streptomyces longwoodensis]|uniref:hypothetical protein n=1 Tax=Streptomyces longwoodensis TaxID=68231 RepID=UPI00225B118B|nr:hypothetical protein [Streptomyces longwoodensis]MCX4993847.1 hypothetical protein [Streptomyces longwoodensis]MCX4998033.1 hypothetical protein [Streptomyces longwoodensis]